MNRDGLIEHRSETGMIDIYSRIRYVVEETKNVDTVSGNNTIKEDDNKDDFDNGYIESEMGKIHKPRDRPLFVSSSPVIRHLLDPPLSRTVGSADFSYAEFARLAQPKSIISSRVLESPSRAIQLPPKSGWELVFSSLSESLKSINIFSGHFNHNELKRFIPVDSQNNNKVIYADHSL
jgi:hypothetical protein